MFSDSRLISRTISCSISDSPQHLTSCLTVYAPLQDQEYLCPSRLRFGPRYASILRYNDMRHNLCGESPDSNSGQCHFVFIGCKRLRSLEIEPGPFRIKRKESNLWTFQVSC